MNLLTTVEWVNVMDMFGTQDRPTFRNNVTEGATIDYVFVNTWGAQFVHGSTIHDFGQSGHLPLEVTCFTPGERSVKCLKQPNINT